MGTARRLARICRVEADVAAPVDAVWRVVSDVTRTGEWSHECHSVQWIDGGTSAVPGARFRGCNKAFWWRWSRTNEVTEIEPGRAIAWITVPTWRFVDSTEWRITVTPTPTGTHIEQSYHVRRCPRWWEWVIVHAIPPHRDRTASLTADLHRIGDVAATHTTRGSTPIV